MFIKIFPQDLFYQFIEIRRAFKSFGIVKKTYKNFEKNAYHHKEPFFQKLAQIFASQDLQLGFFKDFKTDCWILVQHIGKGQVKYKNVFDHKRRFFTQISRYLR